MSKNIIIVILLITVALLVFLSLSTRPEIFNPLDQGAQIPPANSLFKSQTAVFQGEITKVEGNRIFIKAENGQTGDFPISNKVSVYQVKQGPPETSASSSSDPRSIETNKQALIVLQLTNGEYQAVSIAYLPLASPPAR